MNNESIEVIKYKGFDIEIHQDEDYQSPDEWEDENVFLVGFHRQFTINREGFSEGIVGNILNKGKHEDDSINEEARDIMQKYHCFLLTAYIHSGVSLSVDSQKWPYNDRWDSSAMGMVFIAKEEAKTRPKAKKMAESLVKEWNHYLSGEVYGYNIEGVDGGSCWGYYGDYNDSGMLDEAKDNIDRQIKANIKDNDNRLKSILKNHIPIQYRKEAQIIC